MATRRDFLCVMAGFGASAVLAPATAATAGRQPVLVGLDAEFREHTSTSDEAIRHGMQIAIEQINAAGGVLGGRMLKLMALDNRSMPARGVENVRTFIDMPELVAYFCGKFSPVVLEQIALIQRFGLPLMNPWAAADAITRNGSRPNFAFRVGLIDSWAMASLLDAAARRGLGRCGLMLPSTGWGRSCDRAARSHAEGRADIEILEPEWHHWGGFPDWREPIARLRSGGAKAIVLVANEPEGAALVRAMATLPVEERLPIFSHWGVTGGQFPQLCGDALGKVDFSVVQTFSFEHPRNARATALAQEASRRYDGLAPTAIPSVIGIAHAYDLMHMLALAIDQAGTTNRLAIRDALEHLPPYDGVVRHYARAFTADRHEATEPGDLFLARYTAAGHLLRVR